MPLQLQLQLPLPLSLPLLFAFPFRSEAEESAFLPFTVNPMRRDYHFYVYILASRSRNLYIGLTTNLSARIAQHRENRAGTFTSRYNINRLVYYEEFGYINNAIARENDLKAWNRARKIALIEQHNPTWEDLAADF